MSSVGVMKLTGEIFYDENFYIFNLTEIDLIQLELNLPHPDKIDLI